MAKVRSIFQLFILLLSYLNLSLCLYEDQVGKFDWKQSYIGKLKFAELNSVKKIVIGTEQNVIASLHLKNGEIEWRKVLENPNHQLELLYVNKEVVSVSGDGNTWYIRGWDVNNGLLQWEWTMFTENKFNAKWVISKGQLIHVVPVLKSHLEVTSYQMNTGQNSGKTSRISTPWLEDLSNCVLVQTFWACLVQDVDRVRIQYMNLELEAAHIHSSPLDRIKCTERIRIKEIKHLEPAVLLECKDVIHMVIIQEDSVNILPYTLTGNVVSIQNGDQNTLIQLDLNDASHGNVKVRTIDLERNADNIIEAEYSDNFGIPYPIIGVCRGQACRLLIASQDNSISLMQLPAGKLMWTREEALSSVIQVEFVELPVSDLDASIEHEFVSTSGDIFGMLYRRLLSQFHQVSSFFSAPHSISSSGDLIRDDFGLHKAIILVTRVGKLFAIDSLSGAIIWTKFLPDIKPFLRLRKETMLVLEQRSARYPPMTAMCTLLAKDRITGKGVIYSFDPITGDSKYGLNKLKYNVKQAVLLPYEDDNHLKGLLIMSEEDEIYIYPESTKSVLKEHLSTMFVYTADSNAGIIAGYSLSELKNTLKAAQTWQVNLQQSEIVALSVRPSIEKVHSQGRVLLDRSVLYKYVNPNLVALATLTYDAVHKNVLSVYLIDGVSGLVVYSVSHKKSKGPVYLVHSENWVIYSYFNEKFRRYEMAAIELYEGTVQSNKTVFSSHAVSRLPHVETQAYIIPIIPSAITTTLTERGITSKHLLVASSNGGVAELPWAFLEPRGPQVTSGPEEGYIPYMPEIPIASESLINYNQSLERIWGIQVSPARLESTSLVLVYGLDLFYTRVAPSKTFDVLKEDFDHWLIITVLGGLLLVSYFSKHLASRWVIKHAWK